MSGTSILTHVHAKLRPILCNPMDHSPPGFSVHGILQARILDCVAMPSSRGSSQPRDWTCLSYVSWIGRRVLTTNATWETLSHRSLKVEEEPEKDVMVEAGPMRCSIVGFDDGGRGSWNKEWWWPLETVTKQGNKFSFRASRRKVALSTLIFA